MSRTNKQPVIRVEQHEQHSDEEYATAIAGIKNVAREAWLAALASRGLNKIRLSEIEFEMWWESKLEKAKTTSD